MVQVQIDYAPRQWAKQLHANLKRWSVFVLHRRAGKTTAIINQHQRAATDHGWERKRLKALLPNAPDSQIERLMQKRIYWHVLPTYKQAKMVAWDMVKHYANPIPGVKFNASELLVTYPDTGFGPSKLQLIGGDNPDSLRGPGLSGLSLDEYSQIPPNAFGEVLSKALADHLGYAIFAGTIKGSDQLFRMHEMAKRSEDWLAVWRDIDASLEQESGATIAALSKAMEDDRRLVVEGVMTQAEYDQEWYLSPEAAIRGAYYEKQMALMRSEGRITRVPYEQTLPVDTSWDLGIRDSTAIWFSQSLKSGEVRLIDYYENSGEGLGHYVGILQQRGYVYGRHIAPHDIEVRELGAGGKSRRESARALGINFELAPDLSREDGIDAARLLLGRCWVDAEKCAKGLEALRHYKKSFNERLQEYGSTHVHNWAEHGASAFRYLAVSHKLPRDKKQQRYTVSAPSGPYSWAS